jgi:hypothetical protein
MRARIAPLSPLSTASGLTRTSDFSILKFVAPSMLLSQVFRPDNHEGNFASGNFGAVFITYRRIGYHEAAFNFTHGGGNSQRLAGSGRVF